MALFVRFMLGGLVVAAFSAIGELFAPKRFAGIFGAAPSVAIVSLAFAFQADGVHAVATEGTSLIVGALALFVYAQVADWLTRRSLGSEWIIACGAWLSWLAVALLLWTAAHDAGLLR